MRVLVTIMRHGFPLKTSMLLKMEMVKAGMLRRTGDGPAVRYEITAEAERAFKQQYPRAHSIAVGRR